MAGYFFTGVGHIGHRAWPITQEDVATIQDSRFLPCYGLVPSTANVKVRQSLGRGFNISWDNNLEGCVPGITIKEIETCIIAAYMGVYKRECTKARGTPTSAFISLGGSWDRTYIQYVVVESRLYPNGFKYGKKYYSHLHGGEPEIN